MIVVRYESIPRKIGVWARTFFFFYDWWSISGIVGSILVINFGFCFFWWFFLEIYFNNFSDLALSSSIFKKHGFHICPDIFESHKSYTTNFSDVDCCFILFYDVTIFVPIVEYLFKLSVAKSFYSYSLLLKNLVLLFIALRCLMKYFRSTIKLWNSWTVFLNITEYR